jgi:hypothetical protein
LLTVETEVNWGSKSTNVRFLPWLVRWACRARTRDFRSALAALVGTRDNREGWPLLTVETEVNGDSKSTNERGPSLVCSLGCYAGTREFCSALAALVGIVQNIRFLTVH